MLSKYYTSKFEAEGKTFYSVYQYMTYVKAMYFNDIDAAESIVNTHDRWEIAGIEYDIKNYDDDVWGDISYDVELRGNYFKFTQNKSLNQYLLHAQYLGTMYETVRDEIINTKVITLDTRKDLSKLAGYQLGCVLYEEQIKPRLDLDVINYIVFPEYITDVTVGFVKALLCKIPESNFNCNVFIKANPKVLTKVKEYYYF